MAPSRTAVDAELVLHTQYIRIIEVQKICRAPVGVPILLIQFKAHAGRIIVALTQIVHCAHETLGGRSRRCHRLTNIGCEGSDAAQPWQVAAQEGDTVR